MMRAALLASLLATAFHAQEGPRRPPQPPEASTFLTAVPEHPGSAVLARPTATAITVSLLWHSDVEGLLVWGRDPLALPKEGRHVSLVKDVSCNVVLEGLSKDTEYHYALLDPVTRRRLFPVEGTGRFHTARPAGKAFTFTLSADSHLDGSCSLDLYRRSLANILAENPDFHIDLGDTFMTEKHPSRESAAAQYTSQRFWLGQIGQSAPLFLVLGNHDGEGLDRRGQIPADGLAVWAHGMRTRLFPNPVPDAFYAGNPARLPSGAPFEDYCAWTWGDALFVVLDPYWTSTPTRGGREPWNTTLGTPQYQWLARTLRGSKARYKFIFIHQLTGSYHPAGRGGAEAAAFQEWGGRELDGSEGFKLRRPDWEQPIHRLLVETGVTAVFHGHDHFYARQERDGIVYQLVPQPAHRNDRSHHAEEYGYREGTFLPSSGHIRVHVTPEGATVDYVRTALTEHDGRGALNGALADSYRLAPHHLEQAKPIGR